MTRVVERIRMNNNIPACESEAVAYVEFLTGLVEDFGPGIMSRDDIMALFEAYAGPNPPLGKLFPYLVGVLFIQSIT